MYLNLVSREKADYLFETFPYFEEFLDCFAQRNYPVSKCTREMVDLLPQFTKKEEKLIDSLIRPFETDPVACWYLNKNGVAGKGVPSSKQSCE
jgi:hypothetical protein